MLGKAFERFIKKAPVAVMVQSVLERVLNPDALNALYERESRGQESRGRVEGSGLPLHIHGSHGSFCETRKLTWREVWRDPCESSMTKKKKRGSGLVP